MCTHGLFLSHTVLGSMSVTYRPQFDVCHIQTSIRCLSPTDLNSIAVMYRSQFDVCHQQYSIRCLLPTDLNSITVTEALAAALTGNATLTSLNLSHNSMMTEIKRSQSGIPSEDPAKNAKLLSCHHLLLSYHM